MKQSHQFAYPSVLIALLTFILSIPKMNAQQLDATFSIVDGSKLQMVLNADASFEFISSLSQGSFSIVVKDVYPSNPSSIGSSTVSGSITYTSSDGKSGSLLDIGGFGFDFGAAGAKDELLVFNMSGTFAIGETITLKAGTVLQSTGKLGASQSFNAGPYTAFVINSGFTGSAANMVNLAPTSATVVATVFLEGAYNSTDEDLNTKINGSIPADQPYSGGAFNNYDGSENAAAPAGAVDWVLVELREAASADDALDATKVGAAAGFLMEDGTIKATDGTSDLTITLSDNTGSEFFVVIYHRNHLPIMSAAAISESSGKYTIDFTSDSDNTYKTTTALVSLSGGKFGMPAGDTDGDGDIDATDLSTWRTNNGITFSYGSNGVADFNLDGVINAIDRNSFHQKNTTKKREVPGG